MNLRQLPWYVIGFILYLLFSRCLAEYADKQIIFDDTDFPSHLKLHEKVTFQKLNQSSVCSHKTLMNCHSDEEAHYDFFDRCLSEGCSRDDYVCLNDKEGNALHICGQTKPCNKRYRSIVLQNSVHSNSVDVYSIQCPVGHFQANYKICFDICVKDESLTIVRDATDLKPAIAKCSVEKKYCNKKGVSSFEVGSDDDACIHAYFDMNVTCNTTEELMQDCSCQPRCRASEERVWNGSFFCMPVPSNNESVTNNKDIANIAEDFAITGLNGNQSIHQTNKIQDNIGEEPSAKDVETKTENGETISVPIIGLVVLAILSGVAVVILVSCFALKHFKNRKSDQHVHKKTNRYINSTFHKIKTDKVCIYTDNKDLANITGHTLTQMAKPKQMRHEKLVEENQSFLLCETNKAICNNDM